METIPLLPRIYDEPFADASQLPTFLVSRMARRDVTVSLSGDGGDEAFGGYDHYRLGELQRHLGRVPSFARRMVAGTLSAPSEAAWTRGLRFARGVLPRPIARRLRGDNVHLAADYLRSEAPEKLYRRIRSQWSDPGSLVLGGEEPETVLTSDLRGRWAQNPAQLMMYLDSVFYLPEDILVKVDRASMAVGLEARNPFLDHRVQEFAARIPLEMKIRHGQGKWMLRRLLDRHIPRELFERPKKGFSIPVGAWLRGPLRDWAESLLDPARLKAQGYLNADAIRTVWREHLAGTFNRESVLWTALMFESWLEQQHNRPDIDTPGPEIPARGDSGSAQRHVGTVKARS